MNEPEHYPVLRRAFAAYESRKIKRALVLYKRAAKLGSIDALLMLGNIYDDLLRHPNPARARYWYRRGVRRGHCQSAWNLAMHYAGAGRRRWYLYWLRVAAGMGDPDASKELVSGRWWRKRQSQLNVGK